MKTLQKSVKIIYRFRCCACKSQFEVTKEEMDKLESNGRNFNCPVCERERFIYKNDIHKYSVMDNGTEIKFY